MLLQYGWIHIKKFYLNLIAISRYASFHIGCAARYICNLIGKQPPGTTFCNSDGKISFVQNPAYYFCQLALSSSGIDHIAHFIPQCCLESLQLLPRNVPIGAMRTDPDVHPSCMWQISNIHTEEHTSELQSRGHLVCRLL